MRTIKQFEVYEHFRTKDKYCVLGTSTPINSIEDLINEDIKIIRTTNTEDPDTFIDIIYVPRTNELFHYSNHCKDNLVIYRNIFMTKSIIWARYESMFKEKVIHDGKEVFRFSKLNHSFINNEEV